MQFKLMFAMSLTVVLLFGFLFALLAAVGYFFDLSGYVILTFAMGLMFLQWLISPQIIWWTTNMKLLEEGELGWLRDDVTSLCKKNNVPIPKIAIARSGGPNAFVFGRTQSSATLVVTNGLLNTLTKDEVKAVVAHEVGHIKHNDMVVMTMAGAIPILAYYVFRFMIFSRDKDRKASTAMIVGLGAFVVYFVSNLLVLYLSRLREYFSDNFSGSNTNPDMLASALAKITYGLSMNREEGSSSVRSLYIADPLSAAREVNALSGHYDDLRISKSEVEEAMEWEQRNPLSKVMEFFSTHPLTYKRINALKEMSGRGSLE